MSHLKLTVWALPYDGEPTPLPHLRGWTLSPTDDGGSIEIEYPANGRGAELLAALSDDDVDLEVELTVSAMDGRVWRGRALLLDSDGDDVAESATLKVTGNLLEIIFDEVIVPYHPTGEQGETPVGGTAGRIMRELLDAAQGRGCLPGVWWNFTDDRDSDGVPWERSANLRFSPGQLYTAVLGTLRGYQLSEWELTDERELRLLNVGGKGVDRTTGPTPVILERGRDLGDAPRRHTLRGAITDLITSGKDGLHSAAENLTARGRRRRRIEGYHSFNNAADQGSLDALTQARLTTMTDGQLELSHKLVLGGGPLPLIDFGVSDWVLSATRRGVSRRRVKQLTISGSEHEVTTASATLNAVIDERDARLQQQIDDLASGAVVAGTSLPPPAVDDGSIPAAPDGDEVVATSLWYADREGKGLAAVTAAWSPVPDTRVVGYIVEWRYTGGGYAPGWQRLPQVETTTTTWSGVAAGAPLAVRVYAVNEWGRLSAPSSPEWTFATEADGTPPPVASTPEPYSHLGLFVVPWDGRGAQREPMPGDFLRTEIHVSTSPGGGPHRPLLASGALDEATSTTYAGDLRGASEGLPIDIGAAGYGTTFYVWLVTVDRSHNAADPSAAGSAVLQPIADGDVAELNVSKLRSGIMTALVAVAGRLYAGSQTGAGWEGDEAGFRFYNSARQAVLEFIAATAQLLIIGTVQTGRTGRRAVLSGEDNSLRFYPQVGETRWASVGSFIPGNYPNDIAMEMRAVDSDTSDMVSRVTLLPDQVQVSVFDPNQVEGHLALVRVHGDGVLAATFDGANPLVRDGGFMQLEREWAGLGMRRPSADLNAFLEINDDGAIRVQGEWAWGQNLGGRSALWLRTSSLSSEFSGLNITYGATMRGSAVVNVTYQGSAAAAYLSSSNATGCGLRVDPAVSGGIYHTLVLFTDQ